MKKSIMVLLLAILLFTSCSLLQIRSGDIGDTQRVKGIPFYCRVNNLYQVTRWLQTCYLAVFHYKKQGEENWKSVQITVNQAQMMEIQGWFRDLSASLTKTELDSELSNFQDFLNTKQTIAELVYNNLEVKTEIDTSRVYYLNQQLPLVGSSSLEMELKDDGTLAKAKSSAETQTLSTVLDFAAAAFPFQAFFEKELRLAKLQGLREIENFDIKLSITSSRIFLYTLTKKIQKGKDIKLDKALELKSDGQGNLVPAESNVAFEKKEIKPDTEKKDEKTDKKAIEFSGQIALPGGGK